METYAEQLKQKAAERAVTFVEPGMVVGLGHGSTAAYAIRRIADLLNEGHLENILGIPCSIQVEKEARRMGIPLTTLEGHPNIDVTIDGADEVDPELNLIKGAGGALLREKLVAQASRREIIVIDESKLSPALGFRRPVPVEVIPFGWKSQYDYLEFMGANITIRRAQDNSPIETDQGNMMMDCDFGPISDPTLLAVKLKQRPGIVAHGLFIGLATDVIVAERDKITHLTRIIRD